jgi:uncharacterized RDD family membrane protein YckC
MILFLILNLQFLVSANWSYTSNSGFITTIEYSQPINALLFLIITIVYFIITELLWSASIGKLIFREKVVDLQKRKVSFKSSVLRNIFKPIDLILGPIFFLFSTKDQTLGDKIANTIVIRKKLIDLPVVDKPVSLIRKIFAILFLIMILIFVVLIIWTIPKISNLDIVSRTSIVNAKEKGGSDMAGLYNSFSSEFKESYTLEQFEQIFTSPEFLDVLNQVDANKITFYNWQFNKNQAVVIGRQGSIIVRLSFVKDNLGQWKLLGFRLVPGIENISILDLLLNKNK